VNYYDARRREDDKRWDYTVLNDGRCHPVGYCASSTACECWRRAMDAGVILTRGEANCQRCGGSGWVDNPEYCGSHDTEAEARACFARYLLAGWREESYGNWIGCHVCDAPTKKGLATRPPLGNSYALCDEHRTFEQLQTLAPTDAGQITASY
jgi:hypothetical protein